jgi:hypothetical protein
MRPTGIPTRNYLNIHCKKIPGLNNSVSSGKTIRLYNDTTLLRLTISNRWCCHLEETIFGIVVYKKKLHNEKRNLSLPSISFSHNFTIHNS